MLRKIRIALAAVLFIGITLLFLDFTGSIHAWLGWMARVQFLPALLALNVAVVVGLLALLDGGGSPALRGATVADKVIGKAAAALMVLGGVTEVYGAVMTPETVAMLEASGASVTYGTLTSMIANRTNTGRCPLDTLAAPLSTPASIASAIRAFLHPLHGG